MELTSKTSSQFVFVPLHIPVTCNYCHLNFLFMGIKFLEDLFSRVFNFAIFFTIAYNRQNANLKARQ